MYLHSLHNAWASQHRQWIRLYLESLIFLIFSHCVNCICWRVTKKQKSPANKPALSLVRAQLNGAFLTTQWKNKLTLCFPPFQTLTAPAPFADETSCQCRAPHEKLTIAQARLGTPGMCRELHQQDHGHSQSTGSPLQLCINTRFCLPFGSRKASLVSGAIS